MARRGHRHPKTLVLYRTDKHVIDMTLVIRNSLNEDHAISGRRFLEGTRRRLTGITPRLQIPPVLGTF